MYYRLNIIENTKEVMFSSKLEKFCLTLVPQLLFLIE